MPPLEAIRNLRGAIVDNPAVGVLLASQPEQEVVLQRLNLRQELATEFLMAARGAVPADDVVLRAYDPGYKPDRNEICYVELEDHEDMQELLRSISQIQQAEIFRERDEIVDHLRFYAIVLSPSARRHAVFLRTYSPKKELSRNAGFAALFSHGQYDKVEDKIFLL